MRLLAASVLLLHLILLLWSSSIWNHAYAKECTSSLPPGLPLNSKTAKYEFSISNNETWRQEVFQHYDQQYHRRGPHRDLGHDDHLTPSDDSTWASLFPRKVLKKEDGYNQDQLRWNMMYRKLKHPELYKLEQSFLREVPLHDVRLDKDSMFGTAQETNTKYLLMLDVDRLSWSFRKTAGLPTPGKPYTGGWEAPDSDLRGHFVGHYLSATAFTWASTHSQAIKRKMTALVSALKECQEQIGTGYLSAFPTDVFDKYENLTWTWAPYYTVHKIMAGLLDQHKMASNHDALNMLKWMVDYFYNRVRNVIAKYTIERHYLAMNEETGGMNDLLYQLYRITGNEKHLWLAHLFDKPCFLGILAMQADNIAGFHANTHIPIVIGAQMRYEVTGDELYKTIGTSFLDIVNASHTWATGGTTVDEHWQYPMRLGTQLQHEDEETCTTYNMLKVSRNLFRWTKSPTYGDYYERALTNGILSVQRGQEPGVMIYMLPQQAGASKAVSKSGWGNRFEKFWCCYGTGVESFSKLGDSIYFEERGKVPGLYVIQYISSKLNWKLGKIKLHQKLDQVFASNSTFRVTITITTADQGSKTSTLNLRIPIWTHLSGAHASLNGEKLELPSPGNYLSVTRQWDSEDKIILDLPITVRTEAIQDDRPEYASVQAILYGPYLLAGLSTGDYEMRLGFPKLPVSKWVTPVPAYYNSQLVSLGRDDDGLFLSSTNGSMITMEPTPISGNHSSVRATFRLVNIKSSWSSAADHVIGKWVMLEPFEYPGKAIAHQGVHKPLQVVDPSSSRNQMHNSLFRVVQGLDGRKGTISLESKIISKKKNKCFVHGIGGGDSVDTDRAVTLKCLSTLTGSVMISAAFAKATSFALNKGLATYHPLSFVAKADNRNYLLLPLLSYRDEFYTVYFNVTN
ncbi:hypothetical protein Dimus_011509 [Dionaea muscipula]